MNYRTLTLKCLYIEKAFHISQHERRVEVLIVSLKYIQIKYSNNEI